MIQALLVAGATLFAAGEARAFLFSRTELQVNVNVTMTDAGRARPLPTKEKPEYYLPLLAGFLERGDIVAGERPPPQKLVTDNLAKELAKQHYFVMGGEHAPTLILVFHWGYLNPQIHETGDGRVVFENKREALALVAGNTLDKINFGPEIDDVNRAALENRYFMIVSAYDYAAAAQEKKKVLLWRARMSAPSDGIEMKDAVASLIKSGGPHFGRETEKPVWEDRKIVRDGKVEPGPLQVIESDVKTPKRDEPKK